MAKSMSMADALFAKLEARVRSGDMQPGSRFPTQKEIAEQENVSRTVVREAVARLEAQGIAVARQGSGVFVSDDARYRAFQITRDEMGELAEVIRLLEVRLAVESEMAAFAAARRDLDDISALRAALRDMAAVADDPAASAEADARFHTAIARASRNETFVKLIDFLGVRLVPPRNLYLRHQPLAAHRAYVERVRLEHEAIVDAIVRMNPAAARDAARAHMQESLSRHTELSEMIGAPE
ncbi:FadR/GntR family transcriptional regulator [Sphingomonas melonis]|jgi:GntR family transcriptional repressor for pyruvate dehydrogenase complex|uniref:DNA-binding FadR family transcriptional regulator n=1 Tax=Sphingomonas melonis TaxID=152682 RepID=A0A7Y9K2L9_9SPHN|nr:FadR/GntR family transcriptional regulator [Sphingomonas melonis]NYD91131.1 DNA-binding FadR family transcriptional regulator [Sphingomonas melonis]